MVSDKVTLLNLSRNFVMERKLIVYFKTVMRFVWVDCKMKNNGFLIILNFAH